MEIRAIDIGSYSIKLIEGYSDKKKFYSSKMTEYVLEQINEEVGSSLSEHEVRDQILKDIGKELKKDHKIITIVPNEFLTSRSFVLPLKNKRKAEQMLPHQLEDSLPFPLTSCHFGYSLESLASETKANVSISGLASFENLYAGIKSAFSPDFMTSEMSIYEYFVKQNKLAGSFCILDLGHNTTKAYFFYDQNLINIQTSYIAGRIINQTIAENYQIGEDEASIFKHQNAFLLTEQHFNEVDDNQKEFAKIMNKIFAPLITDLNRWELGHQLTTKAPIQTIYLTGGTSNLKNIANYITQKLAIKTQHLNLHDIVVYKSNELDNKLHNKYGTGHILAWSYPQRNKLVNFLTGDYARSDKENIPLHSIAFIASRLSLLTFILVCSLMTEYYFLYKANNDLDKQVKNLLNNQTLELTPKDIRDYKKKPSLVLNKLKSNINIVNQEIKLIESSSQANAISALAKLSRILKNDQDLSVISFSNNDGAVNVIFEAKEMDKLQKAEKLLSANGLDGYKSSFNRDSKLLVVDFYETKAK